MRKVFISYARANKPQIDQLVEHLGELGCQTWVDSSLHGGQDWWAEILRQIEDCDVFVAIISREALNSVACEREFDWAEALGKPVLPVAVETPPIALPRRFSIRQIVDYSEPENRDRAAVRLGGGLAGLPAVPPTPKPLPQPPAAPLSYLTDLVELVHTPALSHDQQRQVLIKLEPALRSVDPEERRGGRVVLERFSSRDDLYADVERTITGLTRLNDQATQPPKPNAQGSEATHPKSTADRPTDDRTGPPPPGPPHNQPRPPGYAPPLSSPPQSQVPRYGRPIALLAASAVVVVLVAFLIWRIVAPDSSGTTPYTTVVPTHHNPLLPVTTRNQQPTGNQTGPEQTTLPTTTTTTPTTKVPTAPVPPTT